MTPKQEVFENAIEAFQRETNARVQRQYYNKAPDNNKPDAELWIQPPEGNRINFRVEVKRTITEAMATRLARERANELQNYIFVTNHLHRRLAKTLKELGLQFMDAAGNAYINRPPVFFFIHGYQRVEYLNNVVYEEGMFGPAGIRVIFALLCKRELWNENYRRIKAAADVALGTVANTMKDLVRYGYLIEKENRPRRLIRQKELLDKWVDAYIEKLRPKKLIGKFKRARPDFWQQTELRVLDALWGGETAAYYLTRYLKPEIQTIYADKPVNNLVLKLKLRRDQNGDIEIRERFWNFDTIEENQNIVPPLLVYADLIGTRDNRNIEAAKQIYADYLEKHIGEN